MTMEVNIPYEEERYALKTGRCGRCEQTVRLREKSFAGFLSPSYDVPLNIPGRIVNGVCLRCYSSNRRFAGKFLSCEKIPRRRFSCSDEPIRIKNRNELPIDTVIVNKRHSSAEYCGMNYELSNRRGSLTKRAPIIDKSGNSANKYQNMGRRQSLNETSQERTEPTTYVEEPQLSQELNQVFVKSLIVDHFAKKGLMTGNQVVQSSKPGKHLSLTGAVKKVFGGSSVKRKSKLMLDRSQMDNISLLGMRGVEDIQPDTIPKNFANMNEKPQRPDKLYIR